MAGGHGREIDSLLAGAGWRGRPGGGGRRAGRHWQAPGSPKTPKNPAKPNSDYHPAIPSLPSYEISQKSLRLHPTRKRRAFQKLLGLPRLAGRLNRTNSEYAQPRLRTLRLPLRPDRARQRPAGGNSLSFTSIFPSANHPIQTGCTLFQLFIERIFSDLDSQPEAQITQLSRLDTVGRWFWHAR